MLSLQHCRRLLGPDAPSSNEELEEVRSVLYALAQICTGAFVEEHKNSHESSVNSSEAMAFDDESVLQSNVTMSSKFQLKTALKLVPADQAEVIEERAAILEYEGKCTRDEAERAALAINLEERRK